MTIPRPAIERFFEKVAAGPNGCIIWTGCVDPKTGYGQFSLDKGTTTTAHRAIYRILVGEPPDGLHLDHLCHNRDPNCPGGRTCLHRRCANHLHLEPVSMGENNLRAVLNLTNANAAKTECANGHPYTPENTIHGTGSTGRPRRRCRTCKTASDRGVLLPRRSAA